MIRRTNSHQSQTGFTLVELTLAVAFISFMILFIVFAITQVMGSYNKGITVKEINQVARASVENMARDVRNADIADINTSAVDDGRVCFGAISYVWNVKEETDNKYADGRPLRFTRARHPAGGALCQRDSEGQYPNVTNDLENALIPIFDDYRMWVNDLDVTVDPVTRLVTIKVILSTTYENQPTQDPIKGPTCSGDGSGKYCAVGIFETTVAPRNGGN